MTWETLGTLAPNLLDWQTVPVPAEGDLFRFAQSWAGEWPGTGYIRLRLLYADETSYEDGHAEHHRLYASRDVDLLLLPFNLIMARAGYSVRYFQARLNLRARPYATANWQLSIEQFIDYAETFDGGEYV